MWVLMDRIGVILFDATLSTAVFLTLIILAMLSCRQPVRRILLARVARGGWGREQARGGGGGRAAHNLIGLM
jgi:hypothetical protein